MIKKVITQILEKKAQKHLTKTESKIVFVIGSKKRSVYKDSIVELLQAKNYKARGNRPGYNFYLGIALTILNKKAGGRSIRKWVHIVLSNSKGTGKEVIVQEFAHNADSDDVRRLTAYRLKWIICIGDNIPTRDQNSSIIEVSEDAGVVVKKEGEVMNIPLLSYAEIDTGIRFLYRIADHEKNVELQAYGKHYAIAYIIADYLSEAL